MKYEYKLEQLFFEPLSGSQIKEATRILNGLGRDGWELVQVNGQTAYLKRELSDKQNFDDRWTVEEIHDEPVNIEELEKQSICRAMEKAAGNRKVAAELLGISERTIYRKMKEYNIQ